VAAADPSAATDDYKELDRQKTKSIIEIKDTKLPEKYDQNNKEFNNGIRLIRNDAFQKMQTSDET